MPKQNPYHSKQVLGELNQLYKQGFIRALDYQFARFLAEQLSQEQVENSQQGLVLWLGALLSYQLGAGHSCVDLECLPSPLFGLSEKAKQMEENGLLSVVIRLPATSVLIDILHSSPLVCFKTSTDDDAETIAPLCLEGSRLYLYRYWHYENEVAEYLKCLNTVNPLQGSPKGGIKENLLSAMERLFPKDIDNPWPRVAASLALKNRLLLISGGPGTGKTTTVTRTLALLLEQAALENSQLHIQLAAPTGKAAARLSESIVSAKSQLNVENTIREKIPDQAKTLHRLLGVIPGRLSFRFNRQNRLHLDLLLVDEASMIDLPMMHALLSALPDHARLILLGDKDQLASVEPGSVLAELCAHGNNTFSRHTGDYIQALAEMQPEIDSQLPDSALANSICQLQKSYRFHENSAIGDIARKVNAGEARVIDAYWRKELDNTDTSIYPLKEAETILQGAYQQYANFIQSCQQVNADVDIHVKLNAFSRFQILCATRQGEWSVAEINQWMEDRLHQKGLINKNDWYIGCPIMITKNSYPHQLYNGDIGVCLADPVNQSQMRIYFPPIDPASDPAPRGFLPSRLPPFDKVYAMTIHKSQGSEFDEVSIMYPPQDSPVLTRELLYTGITRAKKICAIVADKAILKTSIQRKTKRDSGLGQRL